MRASQTFRPIPLSLLLVVLLGGSLVVAAGTVRAAFMTPPVPSITGPGSLAIRPTRAGVPAFAIRDVQRYLATHPFGRTVSGQRAKVREILFMSKEQASAIMNGEPLTMLPAHALVCYVRFQGPFFLAGGFVPIGAHPSTFQIGEEVFDARTGNLLGGGYR